MKKIQETKILGRLHEVLVILFFTSFIIAYRPLVGLTTILMACNAFLHHRLETGKWWNPRYFNLFILGLLLYCAMQTIALFYTSNRPAGIDMFQTNLGMVILPVGLMYSSLVNRTSYGRWMKGYLLILFAATLITLVHATISYSHHAGGSVFFYHALVSIYSNHAIQFSLIVFIGLLFLVEEYIRPVFIKSKSVVLASIVYFSVFLFLLTSKLVIITYFLYVMYIIAFTDDFVRQKTHRIIGLSLVMALVAVAYLTNSPIKKRLAEEWEAPISMIKHDKFSPADYFSGVQFRIISWLFVYEILNEKKAWILGLSPGDSQDVLNEKYRKENMFMGDPAGSNTGYNGYHTHNQFLQATLETGIVGLTCFILASTGLIRLAKRSADRSLIIYATILICYCFTDAPLRTQYGIILFVFFPLLLYKGNLQKGVSSQSL
jgi:O-antigen ligase